MFSLQRNFLKINNGIVNNSSNILDVKEKKEDLIKKYN